MGRRRKTDTDLPKGVYRHGNKYRVVEVVNGTRRWRSFDDLKLVDCAKEDSEPRRHLYTGGMTFRRFEKMLASVKGGARSRNIRFSITEVDLSNLLKRAGGRCEVTGIPFALRDRDERWVRKPWQPSLDRINSREGYYLDNCRIVCLAVNVALNEWGDDVLRTIAKAICDRENITMGISEREFAGNKSA